MNLSASTPPQASGRGVIAVLGPTNTGKTHLAIERMIGHESGLIGLPLRLLAREVYERVAARAGAGNVELVTGEEKINCGNGARYTVATVEAMPDRTDAQFVAIDEVQLAADLERGHVFTDRILNLRGRAETMLLGAATVQRTLQELLPGIHVITRPRMSMLTWAGQKKITRLPQRSAIIAFSADEVYAIAELIRRQRGGAAVVLGSLSPRTRNAQVALYQSGDVDFLVATDAIGMGLNLDLDHVAFSQDRKFDGFSHRQLSAAEIGQIAGRAGRHIRNGTFGVTGQLSPFPDEMVERLETHAFDPLKVLVWRNRDLDYASPEALRDSLEAPSASRLLMKSFPAPDLVALENLSRDEDVRTHCAGAGQVRLLWEVCQIPDYRRISPGEHAELLRSVYLDLVRHGTVDADWFAQQVKLSDRTDGDIDALSARIAHVRTWTYLSHRGEWIADAASWREQTRAIEDRLSDALHEALTKRFIDRRTSVLMRRLRENATMDAEIRPTGEVVLEGHSVGRLSGFRFTPDSETAGPDARTAMAAASKVLAAEIQRRAERLAAAGNGDIAIGSDGAMRWLGEPVAKAVASEHPLRPRVILLADEHLTGVHRDQVASRLERWLAFHIATVLKPLSDLAGDESLAGICRGLAYRLVENFGILDRREVATDIQALDQDMRASLRRHGVRFGALHVFIPALLKPAPTSLICLLWSLTKGPEETPGLAEVPAQLAAGRTSFDRVADVDDVIHRLCGYRILGTKAVRIDILERLADLIRPALAWRSESGNPAPDGAVRGGGFVVTPAMLSILGATHESMAVVLTNLGYRGETKPAEQVEALSATPQPPKKADEAATAKEDASVAEGSTQDLAGSEADSAAIPTSGEAAASVAAIIASARPEVAKTEEPLVAQSADGTAETPEPKTITVWRPSRKAGGQGDRRERSPHRRGRDGSAETHRNDRAKHAKPFNAANGADGKERKPRPDQPRFASRKKDGPRREFPARPPKARAPERKVDPDSPFAKLAALKARLEKPTPAIDESPIDEG
jgi:ATP-dependent RNA helicase SUPV3L1/SUV3